MFDVITIGSSLVDIFLSVPKLELKEGDKVELETMKVYSGGGGTNTAVGFARLGFETALISETGKDNFASVILTELQREGVDISLVVRERMEQTGGSVILVGHGGGRTALIHRGASSELDVYDVPPFWLSQTHWVHLSNIAGREATLHKIFLLIKKNPQVSLSWNPGKRELALIAEGVLSAADIPCKVLILNATEWALVEKYQSELIKAIPEIIVTDGGRGGYAYVDGKKAFKYSGSSVKSTDDTGAGDAFATGYSAARLLGQPPKKALSWGVRNAESVIQSWGAKAGLLNRDRIQAETLAGGDVVSASTTV